MALRAQLHQAFYAPRSRYFLLTNDVLALVTILSILGLVLETVVALGPYAPLFAALEYSTVGIFTAEYVARIYAQGRRWRSYVFSFFGAVDLIAIIPTYLGVANLTFLKAARVFRILQLLRMLRIFKLTRMTKSTDEESSDNRANRLTLHIYFLALFAAILLFGTLLYIFEANNPEFANIPLAMLWAVKPLLGGVAQTMPTTLTGDIIVVLIRFTGLVLFGLLVNVVGTNIRSLLLGKRATR